MFQLGQVSCFSNTKAKAHISTIITEGGMWQFLGLISHRQASKAAGVLLKLDTCSGFC